MPTHNWASALKSTYVPPQENSLLAQTGDMATFMDWYCKQQGISEITPKDLEGPAFEICQVFHHDVIHSPIPNREVPSNSHRSEWMLQSQVPRQQSLFHWEVNLDHVTIQPDFFSNKELWEYLRFVHDQFWIAELPDTAKPPQPDGKMDLNSSMTTQSLDSPRAVSLETDTGSVIIEVLHIVTNFADYPDAHIKERSEWYMMRREQYQMTDPYFYFYRSYKDGKVRSKMSNREYADEMELYWNNPTRIKQRWRWRHLVPVKSIHHPMLTLNASNFKTTAWNKFSSTMASAIICLATNQKFNFLKYIFESMVKNLDNVGKFLMYPRFVQVFVNQQLEGMPTHKRIYIEPSHIKKIFGNMRRVGKSFSGRETPLFQTMVVQDHAKMGEGLAIPIDSHHTHTIIQPSTSQPQKAQKPRRSKRKNTKVVVSGAKKPWGILLLKLGLRMYLNILMIHCAAHKVTTTSKFEASLKLNELMKLCTNLQQMVLDLETTKTTQATEIASLKRRVKKLERRNKVESSEDEGLDEEDASKQEMIVDINANEDIYLVNIQTDEDMFGVNDLDGDEVIVESIDVNTAEETKTLTELKSAKPKVNKVVIQEPEQGTTTPTLTTIIAATIITAVSTRPKAKGLVIHEQEQAPTPTVSLQQPSQVKVQDKELAFKLQAKEEEERLAREKSQQVEEANIAWNDIQAKIDADYQLAQRLQAQDQDELTDKEKARLFVQFLEQRRQHFAAKRAEEKRNKPPTRAQQGSIITELVEESSKKKEAEIAHESSLKRAGEELEQESSKKQKLEEEKESEELKQCLEIIPDDVTIDATPLSTKSPTIMLKNLDKEDLEVIWSIVKASIYKKEAVNYMDNFFTFDLKDHVFETIMLKITINIKFRGGLLDKSLLKVTAAQLKEFDLLKWDPTRGILLLGQQVVSELVALKNLSGDMDQDSTHMVATSKVHMLKPENGNTAPKTIVVKRVEKVIPPTNAEEKAQKRLEVKAKSTLMMGIPNKD
ncbi:hypothetical protein Tco_0695407 [Tanacetum coccineum]